jgi:hypothetical protein
MLNLDLWPQKENQMPDQLTDLFVILPLVVLAVWAERRR